MVKLGVAKKIYARECIIKSVDKQEEKRFLDINHLQGYVPSKFAFGLYFNDELVSIMTVGKPRFDKNNSYELLRYCNKLHTIILGGAEKLFSKVSQLQSRIVSYSDLSKFSGKVYEKLKFEKTSDPIKPGYFWTDGNIVLSRFKCQKSQLKHWLTTFNPTLSEAENMFAAGYRRYWDCGHQKYVFTHR